MRNTNYLTVKEVHNRALQAKYKPMIEINGNVPLSGKSGPGDAFEHWFGKEKDSASEPDLSEAGVELKTTPYIVTKRGMYSAKERLVLNLIDYNKLAQEKFQDSHFLCKNRIIELAFYKNEQSVPRDQWMFTDIILYRILRNKKDIKVIKKDWETIKQYVLDGKADKIDERITSYLSACTKGASSDSVREQPFSHKKAKQRAFSLKSGYMTNLLRNYIKGNEETESIISDELPDKTLNRTILDKLNQYKEKSINKLLDEHGIIINNNSKAYNYQAASIMLGLNSSHKNSDSFDSVEELEKSDIKIKTVSLDQNNKNRQSMSLPNFEFKKIVKEDWNDSDLRNYFIRNTFLFFVVQKKNDERIFKGAKLFHVPYEVIDGEIKKVWQDTVKKINEGVVLKATRNANGKINVHNNFIGINDRLICHVRPHTAKTDYSIDGNHSFALPHNINWINRPRDHDKYSMNRMTRQSFWLNASYIEEQIKDLLK